jgi:hypothetical protein
LLWFHCNEEGQLVPTLILAVAAMLLTTTAQAAAVHDCGGSYGYGGHLDSISHLVGNVRSFAEGDIRVAHISTEEPAAAPEHLLIFVAEEPIGLECYAVSADAERAGFSSIDMDGLKATYDSNKGLLISVPVRSFDSDKGRSVPAGRVKVRINRKNNDNTVTVEK